MVRTEIRLEWNNGLQSLSLQKKHSNAPLGWSRAHRDCNSHILNHTGKMPDIQLHRLGRQLLGLCQPLPIIELCDGFRLWKATCNRFIGPNLEGGYAVLQVNHHFDPVAHLQRSHMLLRLENVTKNSHANAPALIHEDRDDFLDILCAGNSRREHKPNAICFCEFTIWELHQISLYTSLLDLGTGDDGESAFIILALRKLAKIIASQAKAPHLLVEAVQHSKGWSLSFVWSLWKYFSMRVIGPSTIVKTHLWHSNHHWRHHWHSHHVHMRPRVSFKRLLAGREMVIGLQPFGQILTTLIRIRLSCHGHLLLWHCWHPWNQFLWQSWQWKSATWGIGPCTVWARLIRLCSFHIHLDEGVFDPEFLVRGRHCGLNDLSTILHGARPLENKIVLFRVWCCLMLCFGTQQVTRVWVCRVALIFEICLLLRVLWSHHLRVAQLHCEHRLSKGGCYRCVLYSEDPKTVYKKWKQGCGATFLTSRYNSIYGLSIVSNRTSERRVNRYSPTHPCYPKPIPTHKRQSPAALVRSASCRQLVGKRLPGGLLALGFSAEEWSRENTELGSGIGGNLGN